MDGLRCKIISSALACSALIVTPASAHGDAQSQALTRYLTQALEAWGVPGFSAIVTREGKVVYRFNYGTTAIGGREAVTSRHLFHMASVSKAFVATGIMRLVEDGKVGLDDEVIKHLPYFAMADERARRITLRQLLTHSAGMPDVEDYEWAKPQYDDAALERWIGTLGDRELLWDPGRDYRYSNLGFEVLGDVVAKVSGKSFEQAMRDFILDPLGMRSSSFLIADVDPKLMTEGHTGAPHVHETGVYPYNRRHAPSGTLNASMEDMAKWLIFFARRGDRGSERILQRQTIDRMWAEQHPTDDGRDIALGWFAARYEGHRIRSNRGGDTGFSAQMTILPDNRAGFSYAFNSDEGPFDQLTTALIRFSLDLPMLSGPIDGPPKR